MGYSLVALSMMILYILALMYRYSFTEVLSLVSFLSLSPAYVRTSVCGLKLLVYTPTHHACVCSKAMTFPLLTTYSSSKLGAESSILGTVCVCSKRRHVRGNTAGHALWLATEMYDMR